MSTRATSTQSNEDTQILQRDHRLRLFAQHDRSVHDTFLQTGELTPVVACRNSDFWRWMSRWIPLMKAHAVGWWQWKSDCSPWCHPSTLLVLRAVPSDLASCWFQGSTGNAAAIRVCRARRSRNAHLLIRAYLNYVRPLVEHDSVIWSPYTVKDGSHWNCSATFH